VSEVQDHQGRTLDLDCLIRKHEPCIINQFAGDLQGHMLFWQMKDSREWTDGGGHEGSGSIS